MKSVEGMRLGAVGVKRFWSLDNIRWFRYFSVQLSLFCSMLPCTERSA